MGADFNPRIDGGLVVPGKTVAFEGVLGNVLPQAVLTHFLVDRVHPLVPRAESAVAARLLNDVVGVHRTHPGGGQTLALGMRPRDDQSASLGQDVATWFHVLRSLGAYAPTNAFPDHNDQTEHLSRTGPHLACRFPNGATAVVKAEAKDSAQSARKVLYWHDPMTPGQKFDKPGKSPFMDMQLVPVYADDAAGGGVTVSPAMTSNLGIRTAVARTIAVASRIEVVGSVAENERASAVVQARTAGYIEKLYARANFDPVAAGAPVALLYAPEWAGAQAEYLALRRAPADAALVAAARQRLRLLSIPDSVVDSAERSDAPEVRYTLTAPRSGVVTDLAVRVVPYGKDGASRRESKQRTEAFTASLIDAL
jgi:hypothetical protein